MKPNPSPRLPTHLYVALALITLLILASCFSRQMNNNGMDFQAYYKAAARWLSSGSPYVYERDFSYKYAPVVVLPFTFFQLFPYDVARWIYAALHALIALSLPYMLYAILDKDKRLRLSTRPETFVIGVLVAFVGCLRFIDSEFHVSQIGLWIIGTLLVGLWILQQAGHRWWGRTLGLALLSLSALVKIHTAIFFASFLKKFSWKTWAWVGGVFVVVALLPDPRLWLEWAEQIRITTHDLPIQADSVNLQGFYPFAVLRLGLDQFSAEPLLLTLPLFVATFLLTSRFSLRDVKHAPLAVLLTLSTWMLLGFMASPLPWQYTYSILWVLVPMSWVAANTREKRWLFGLALFLGLSPQGIIGRQASLWIEMHHSVFAAILVFWVILLGQARRWGRVVRA